MNTTPTEKNQTGSTETGWRWLYRAGAAAAMITVFVFRRNIAAEISLLGIQKPDTVAGWFALLQTDTLLGLAQLDLFDIVNYALLGLLLLALYPALRRFDRGVVGAAVTLGIVGVGVYFASNQAFSLLALSERYTLVADDQKTMLLAAGEALLASHRGTGILLSLFSVSLAGLLISIVMLRSDLFSKVTASLGIVAHGLVLAYFPTLFVAPALTFIPHTAAAVPLVVWEFLIARKLWQMANQEPPARPQGTPAVS